MEDKKKNSKAYLIVITCIYLVLMYATCHANAYMVEHNASLLAGYNNILNHIFTNPLGIFPLNWKAMGVVTLIYVIGLMYAYTEMMLNQSDMKGKENGSAEWFKDFKWFNKKYVDPEDKTNMIFSNEVKLNMNTHKTRKNCNVLVIGGSGTGKSRFCVKPNILQANCSFIVTDPSGELLKTQGHFLQDREGYKIKVFDLTNMAQSSHYNPFNYIRDEEGVLLMINCLIKNTNGDKKGGDPFWENSEKALLSACCFYLVEELPKEQQNFANVMKLLNQAEISEDDPDAESILDIMMNELEEKNPESMAVKNYKIFKMAGPKTAMSILVSAGVRLQVFNFNAIKTLTSDDTLDLATLGDEKQALFVVIPAADDTFNFLVSMMYSQLFETLYYHAEHDFDNLKLPVHVRFLCDEFANIGSIPSFEKKLSTMRKYEISCTVILQSLSQLKAMYEKQWEVLVDNCDSLLFLGCQGESTLKYINTKLGKRTIRSKDSSRSKGKSSSTSTSTKHEGRDLMTVDELAKMPDDNCILFIRGLSPFYCTKFKLESHKNFKYSGDATKINYIYDPYKNMPSGKTEMANVTIIDDVTEAEDVNAYRIRMEKERAEAINSGEPEQTKNGYDTHKYKTIEERVPEIMEQAANQNLEFDAPFDNSYEFRTKKTLMFNLDEFNPEDEVEEDDDFFGGKYSEFEGGEEPPVDEDEPSDSNWGSFNGIL